MVPVDVAGRVVSSKTTGLARLMVSPATKSGAESRVNSITAPAPADWTLTILKPFPFDYVTNGAGKIGHGLSDARAGQPPALKRPRYGTTVAGTALL